MTNGVFVRLLVSIGSFWLLVTHDTNALSAIPKHKSPTLSDNISNNDNNNNSNKNKNSIMSLAPPAPRENGEPGSTKNAILRVHGPDANGIVAAFSQLLYGHGCGIVDSEQHTDHTSNLFFQRIHFDYTMMHTDRISLTSGIKEVCERFQMKSDLNWGDKRKKVCVMISKYDHCLWELLLRHRAGELDCDIALIISNHPDLQNIADSFGIPFHVFKVTKDTKQEVEAQELALMKDQDIDLVVLARYMQIITDDFCAAYPVINIHHSFLPAFIGGKPYHRAHERGVKVRMYGALYYSYHLSIFYRSIVSSLSDFVPFFFVE